MNTILSPLAKWPEYEEVVKALNQSKTVSVSGCIDSEKLHMAMGICDGIMSTGHRNLRNKLILTYSELRAREIVEDMRLYERNVMLFPAKDLIFYQADIHGDKLITDRMAVIKRLVKGEALTIVTTFDAIMTHMLPKEVYSDHIIRISSGDTVDEKKLAVRLSEMGYERTAQVEGTGQFSVRGGIIDIYDPTNEQPYRIELWGEDVESIRSFDAESQRSYEKLESVEIFPCTELVISKDILKSGLNKIEKEAKTSIEALRADFHTEEAHRLDVSVKTLMEDIRELGRLVNLESYIDYFCDKPAVLPDYLNASDSLIILDEPSRLTEHIDAVEYEFEQSMSSRLMGGYVLPGQTKILYMHKEALNKCKNFPILQLSTLDDKGKLKKPDIKVNITVRSVAPYKGHFDMLLKDLKTYRKNGYNIVVLSPSKTRAGRLAADLRDNDIAAVYSPDPARELIPGETLCMHGSLRGGFEYPLLKFVVISESDIFGSVEHKKRNRTGKYSGQKISDFAELKVGDYVVHIDHGVGIYKGIEKVKADNVERDYMKIEYRDGGILYVLASGFDVVQKYASVDTAAKPKLNKLGGKEWVNTKTKVKEAVDVVAQDLVKLYAARQHGKGHAFSQDTVWQKEFEELFPYEETEDQLAAVEDTKRDMESDRIMDRLICGDVGYGKTEIALRAAFKAVTDGKQVAVLVPTTILASQHYNTFTSRMMNFPIKIEVLSRFKTASEQREIIDRLGKGLVDIVIGTHRLLSDDVRYKDLGLLIVDEEQRFGVTHKEKLKKLKENVDVLTLSATPIPRTLHMSLAGIRDMSVLTEPPGERLPIQTFVCEYNEQMVIEAIVRELSRSGQVYYIYNRVAGIADVTARLSELVPEANIAYAHGQMKESELERLMYEFISGDIDVLVSTTIIETGMDISNVNTVIIQDSDRFGLSQLYQLRGRVGRSNRTAYAFLMYKRDMLLKEAAEKRLEAIREFTELGSGFKIAMRDLEIRGAGNMLGRKQHGHMEAVGYDLYCKMLSDAVRTLKGEEVENGGFETEVDLKLDAYIPPEYITNEVAKLDIYKRIASIEDPTEAEELTDELIDRFGKVPSSVLNLLKVAVIRCLAHKVYITEIRGGGGNVKLMMKPDAEIKVEAIPDLMIRAGKGFRFITKGIPYFVYNYKVTGIEGVDEKTLLDSIDNILGIMNEILI